MVKTVINVNRIVPEYFYHYLLTQRLEELNIADGVPSLTKTVLDRVKIPLPPLPVQHEIVCILDNFTELTARRKQYEYYRDLLLIFGDEVELTQALFIEQQDRIGIANIIKKINKRG